jgi:hypothetical protein
LLQSIRTINVFQSGFVEPARVHKEIVYTRVYLFLFAASLTIVVVYSSFVGGIITKTHLQPSIADYAYLLDRYTDAVNCPCTKISIPYKTFIHPPAIKFHEVCTSGIIDDIASIGRPRDPFTFYENILDFRNWEPAFVDGLNRLCNLANTIIMSDTDTFLASNLLIYQVISRVEFHNEMNITLNRLELLITSAFGQTLDLLRSTIQDNSLIDVFSLSWKFVRSADQNMNTTLLTVPMNNDLTCSCSTTRSCTQPGQLYSLQESTSLIIEGLVVGCFFLETILRSSLWCFYSETCVIECWKAWKPNADKDVDEWVSSWFHAHKLDAQSTRFSVNDTIETLAYNMFVESWTSNTSYEMLFDACNPKQCTYTYHYRFSALQIITTILGVFSGLSLVLRLAVPHLVTIVEHIWKYARIILM